MSYDQDPVDILLMMRREWVERGINSISFSHTTPDLLDALQRYINAERLKQFDGAHTTAETQH